MYNSICIFSAVRVSLSILPDGNEICYSAWCVGGRKDRCGTPRRPHPVVFAFFFVLPFPYKSLALVVCSVLCCASKILISHMQAKCHQLVMTSLQSNRYVLLNPHGGLGYKMFHLPNWHEKLKLMGTCTISTGCVALHCANFHITCNLSGKVQ